MISAVSVFALALLIAISLTPLVRRFALAVGAVDTPGGRRVHAAAIPRLGGIAIVAAFFVPLLCLFAFETEVARAFFAHPRHILGLALGGLLMCGLGVFDDVSGVRAWHKLWVQITAGAIAYACHFRIDAISIPFFGNLDMGIFGLPVTILWVVAIINAINLIDGLDGLAGGIAFFACITNFVVGAINADPVVMLLSASLGGALLGFLLFNFNPASIFMGDSGSMFLGYVLGTVSIMGASVKSSTTVAILAPLIALGLPIMDTLFAMVRRFLERRPIFAPDQGHIHHRLLAMGLTHRRSVLLLYGLSIVFTTGSIIVSIGRNWQVGVALAILSVMMVGVMRAMGNLQVSVRRWLNKERIRPDSVERLRVALPTALSRIASARDLDDVQSILEDFCEKAMLTGIELNAGDGSPVEGFTWTRERRASLRPDGTEREAVSASFTLAGAGTSGAVHFAWLGDQPEMTPEEEILLQLVVDVLDSRLQRTSEARRASTTGGRLRPVS
ncbi:MAG TPA: MraY family glycosyltransferase [Polyangiales bacterium]|jgi:UDP-GlcNAc:undecaprenyl-phosphate GlcNAc-1-phosphate transferase|nr:MraY family glycosyltransferase [Polyangiales bacterium]